MITHSFIVAVVESYAMVEKQVRLLTRLLPSNWELILVDDGTVPAIPMPSETPAHFQMLRTNEIRKPGEWTQHEAINKAVATARGTYIVKSDIDHVFTPEAVAAAERFTGDMMLFHRRAALLTDNLTIWPLEHEVHSPVDDIWIMRRDLFLELGGYPVTRRYGGAGKAFWEYSRKPEAQPSPDARIFVTPDTHEKYHGLERRP